MRTTWWWYGGAGVASAAFAGVFVHGALVANWYVRHPVIVPGDDSPGGGNMGNVVAVPLFGIAAVACVLFPVLWGIAASRTTRGPGAGELPVLIAVLQGVASMFALPVARRLPYGWADVGLLVLAHAVAVVAVARRRRKGSSAPASGEPHASTRS